MINTSPSPKLFEPRSPSEGLRFPVENGIPASAPYVSPRILTCVMQVTMLMLAKRVSPTSRTVSPPASFAARLVNARLKFVYAQPLGGEAPPRRPDCPGG